MIHGSLDFTGDPGAIRTRDPQLRRLLLYPTELRDPNRTAKVTNIKFLTNDLPSAGNLNFVIRFTRCKIPLTNTQITAGFLLWPDFILVINKIFNMRILNEKAVLLVIDFQERIFPAIYENEQLKKNVPTLIDGMKALGVPVIVTEQYVKGLGPTIGEISGKLEGIERIEKASFSCCDEPAFMMELASSGKDYVIISGIESHVCVLQTVIDLKQNGYHPVVVEDCISSRKENDKKNAIERMRHEGVIITTYEAILFELLRYSGGDTFKAISRLVK